MKLQKQVAYKYKDVPHYRYVIVVPNKIIEGLGWKEGEDLKTTVEESRLIFEKSPTA
jgi:bifunctional DNA-binding transcriptional regulator/antitoxin component of YhaV-PrlF toxin-antitoxin module